MLRNVKIKELGNAQAGLETQTFLSRAQDPNLCTKQLPIYVAPNVLFHFMLFTCLFFLTFSSCFLFSLIILFVTLLSPFISFPVIYSLPKTILF